MDIYKCTNISDVKAPHWNNILKKRWAWPGDGLGYKFIDSNGESFTMARSSVIRLDLEAVPDGT